MTLCLGVWRMRGPRHVSVGSTHGLVKTFAWPRLGWCVPRRAVGSTALEGTSLFVEDLKRSKELREIYRNYNTVEMLL